MGLRELKKRRTHDAIAEAALDLFEERGFDATTIADIAERAEVAPRTVFVHFASKEDLVFFRWEQILDELGERLSQRPPGGATAQTLREWIGDMGEMVQDHIDADDRRQRLVDGDPHLSRHVGVVHARMADLLSASFARDLGVDPADASARLAAAATVGALSMVRDHSHNAHERLAVAEHYLERALAFIEGGIAALRPLA